MLVKCYRGKTTQCYSMLHLEDSPFTSVLVYNLQIIWFPYVTLYSVPTSHHEVLEHTAKQ